MNHDAMRKTIERIEGAANELNELLAIAIFHSEANEDALSEDELAALDHWSDIQASLSHII